MLAKAQKKARGFKNVRFDLGITGPVVSQIEGFYEATLIGPDFVIRQVYYPSHFLARGYDFKKEKELEGFCNLMRANPAPHLGCPGKGGIARPHLIPLRYPIIKDGKLKNIVSLLVRTEYFLKAAGLDKYKFFQIICGGKIAETKGKLPVSYQEARVKLPAGEWAIRYGG